MLLGLFVFFYIYNLRLEGFYVKVRRKPIKGEKDVIIHYSP